MIGVIAPHNFGGETGSELQQGSRHNHDKRRQACREKVEDIIQTGGEFPEIEVTLGAVTDHRVQGAGRFVSHSQRNAAQEEIEERRHDAVAGAFGE